MKWYAIGKEMRHDWAIAEQAGSKQHIVAKASLNSAKITKIIYDYCKQQL